MLARLFGEEQAVGGVLAPPDPAAQLVQLGDAEALGPLDHHHRRVGDVDADLDHGRRDQHVGLAGGEGGHRRRLLGRGHLAVQDADLELAQLAAAQPLRLLLGRLARLFLGLDDQRADDEGLAALAQPGSDELVGGVALAPRRPARSRPGCRPAGSSRSAVVSRSP